MFHSRKTLDLRLKVVELPVIKLSLRRSNAIRWTNSLLLARLGIKRDPVSRLPILDPGHASGFQPFALRPWQATGVQWMFSQESELIRGGIVADACGMGKTPTALTLIFLDAKRRSEDPNAVFRPNLIVVPSMIFYVWFDEIKSRFGDAIELNLFYGWKEILPEFESDPKFLLGVDEREIDRLARAVAALDPKRPHTAFTVFLTTYNTWRMCQYETERGTLLLSETVRITFIDTANY
ncbi:SNF2-related protein [Penicillium subrubescens]|uniref:SNF2-related protein n=1 Tax=Penicillium subrubescens TaxID=1316194 RepID=UPI0025450AEE|nr:SNF2-related protein [Penicillium subrubescens]KAJ5911706.1 SNF2-related protein [Penicillium subrubescens]